MRPHWLDVAVMLMAMFLWVLEEVAVVDLEAQMRLVLLLVDHQNKTQ